MTVTVKYRDGNINTNAAGGVLESVTEEVRVGLNRSHSLFRKTHRQVGSSRLDLAEQY